MNSSSVTYGAGCQGDSHAVMMGEAPNEEEDRDANIFALGDAAANLEDLDEDLEDLFAGFGVNLTDILSPGADRKVTTKRMTMPSASSAGSVAGGAGEGEAIPGETSTVEVSTISQKMSDGRSVHTRVIKGPVQCTKRVVRISREGPNGMELVTEIEAPPGSDVNSILASAIPQSLGFSQSSVYADYDNLNPNFRRSYTPSDYESSEFSEGTTVATSEVVGEEGGPGEGEEPEEGGGPGAARADEDVASSALSDADSDQPLMRIVGRTKKISPTRDLEPARHAHIDVATTRDHEKPRVGFNETSQPGRYADANGVPDKAEAKNILDNHQASQKVTSRTAKSVKRRGSGSFKSAFKSSMRKKSLAPLPDEEAIELYEPPEVEEENTDSDDSRSCLICSGKTSKKRLKLKSFTEQGKKSGMTALHPETEGALPGIKALVANYAKMLYEEKDQFVQTMYRAVKLNNLDVIRILCKIVQKSGYKLSGFDLREPESSATILHVALLYNHANIVRMLLALKDRELILAKYETPEYRNQTGLHLAVANENPQLIESILLALEPHDRVLLINTIADGKYFRNQHPDGQLCLTAAAWAGNVQVIQTLVKYGGQLGLRNSHGNSLLHSIIIQSMLFPDRDHYEKLYESVWTSCGIQAEQLTQLYDTKYQQQKELKQKELQEELFRDLLQIRNNDGCTPLALSVTVGSRLFKSMLNMEKIFKIPQNKLGSIAWVTYDVTDITSFANDKYNKFSVLHILAHNSKKLSRQAAMDTDQEEDFLELEPIKSIVTLKWKRVYRWVYILWMVVHLVYMMVFTACTASTNSKPLLKTDSNMNKDGTFNTKDIVTEPQLWFAIFMILPSIYLFLECIDIGGIKPYKIQFLSGSNYFVRATKILQSEWTITGNGPYRLVNFGFSSLTLQWFILYVGKDEMQDIALAMSLLLGWIFVLFFTRACRVTCRFSIMIQKMFFRDLIYFLTVYGIILLAFSFAMSALFTYMGNADITINKVFYDMMNVVTDLDQKQSVEDARHPMFAKLLLILYAIIAVILLMNMLIAMMNTSYESIRLTRCNLWKQQQLSIMLMMERRFFWLRSMCRRSEEEVWRKQISENCVRSYMDVTMLRQPGQKVS